MYYVEIKPSNIITYDLVEKKNVDVNPNMKTAHMSVEIHAAKCRCAQNSNLVEKWVEVRTNYGPFRMCSKISNQLC